MSDRQNFQKLTVAQKSAIRDRTTHSGYPASSLICLIQANLIGGNVMENNRIRARAKEIFPTVLLTLLSIVQALALELMWGHVADQSYLYDWSFTAVLSWLQVIATLFGVLLIWLIYSDLVLRLSWVPNTIDALFPFFVGILEFAQISALGPAKIGLWFSILSCLFAAMSWISHVTMKRARQDDDNREFFSNTNPAAWRDHLLRVLPVGVLLFVGIAIWISGNQGWFALVAVIGAIGLLAFQIWMNHVYTQRSYAL